MATTTNHKLGNVNVTPFKDARNVAITANFGLRNAPAVTIESAEFTNDAKSPKSDIIRNNFAANPAVFQDYTFEVNDFQNSLSYAFDFLLKFDTGNSDVSTSVKLFLDRSVESLEDFNGADITMLLLEAEGFLTNSDYVNVPYIVQNRKSDLEKIALLTQIFLLIKSFIDEIFKLLAIASDFTSLGVIQATINLGITLFNIGIIITQLVNLIKEARETFFPPIRYHSAIKLKTFITKALSFLGYGVDFGTSWPELDGITLLPSQKNIQDEVGTTNENQISSGKLNPDDFGHNLAEALDLCKMLANVDLAIVNNIVQIRPKKDVYWQTNSSYIMPSVKIEQSDIVSNGKWTYNFDENLSGFQTKYATDDSDYWTIQDAADIYGSTGNRISTTTVRPSTAVEQRKVNIGGSLINDIPYSLCVRKGTLQGIFGIMDNILTKYNEWKADLEQKHQAVFNVINAALPTLAVLSNFLDNRKGALKVENHFFDRPKMVYLGTVGGKPTIPEDFNDKIGATAIYNNYWSYNSLVPGVRNPNDLTDTNGKRIFTGVTVKFTLKDLVASLNLGYFTSQFGRSHFISIKWIIAKDEAEVDFWVQDAWLTNVVENVT